MKPIYRGRAWLAGVGAWWVLLGGIALVFGQWLDSRWSDWAWGAGAAAVWGLNVLVLVIGVGPPYVLSRPPILATAFALLMTVFGLGSYWATIQLYPLYRVGIERAAWFVAVCTFLALLVAAVGARVLRRAPTKTRRPLEWHWPRLGAITYAVFFVALVGTVVTLRRIGNVPILSGDPTMARVDFPALGGVWYRLSMLGGVSALLVAVLVSGRRATPMLWLVGLSSLALVGGYGPRFFVVLPLGVSILLWDRVRSPINTRRLVFAGALGIPLLAILGYWREQDSSVALLGPIGLALYGTLGEFRDLGWALDYYGFGDRFLHGQTIGSLIVPLLPAPVWRIVGIDKAAIYAQDSAHLLADAMGQTAGQRIGAYGEMFMNFGWTGALIGAVVYGALLGYLDDRFTRVQAREVRAIFLALVITATVFAQIGQLNMFTSTVTGLGYPMALVALMAARRAPAEG